MDKANIKVGGLQPFTTIDFPGHIACVVFMQGCPFRCPYCHNPELLDFNSPIDTSWDEVLAFLETRVNLLDGVVFSGGEPTAQKDLKRAIENVRELGFFVALHTNGYNPEALAKVLPLVNWIGLDVKAPFDKYGEKIGRNVDGKDITQSLALITHLGIPFEARTTLDPRILDKDDVLEIARALNEYGVKNYALQQYRAVEEDKNVPSIPEIVKFLNDEKFLDEIRKLIPNLISRVD